MRLILCTLTLFFVVMSAANARAESVESVDYFAPATKEEMQSLFEQLGINSCDEFVRTYFESDIEPLMIPFVRGMSYDIALCVPQNLDKAKEIYENSPNDFSSYLPITGRLALIYAFGPEALRNPEKADFYFRQTAIFFAPYFDIENGDKVLSDIMNKQPVPKQLRDYIDWYKEALKKPYEERKALYHSLKEQGFAPDLELWSITEEAEPPVTAD